ncbi:MFS transporter [Lichenicola sp.]|uniref:MFS transporter n=1 Tax=Lichenicola sp. TaxID=2804529 RepID=UPI003AFFFEA3
MQHPASRQPLARPASPERIARGSPDYRRFRIALFLAGFSTFSLLYCVQPLLTVFRDDFRTSPAGASLALSLSTGCLAASILCTTPLAAWAGRRRVMGASMVLAALCNIAVAFAPGWSTLLLLRAIEGVLLGGVPAVAMAHLAEEIDPADLGAAMGLYVGGTAFGGMAGRVGTAFVSDHAGWRAGMLAAGVSCLLAALLFLWLLPTARAMPARTEAATSRAVQRHLRAWWLHLRDPGMGGLFLTGFLAMSTFVTVYNYLGFRLLRPPFSLSQGGSGAVFMVYLFGIVASPLAGRVSARFGRAPVLIAGQLIGLAGLALTLDAWLPSVLCGLALITVGFFVSHAIASAWVGHRATIDKGHAASLYLLAYYLGSSIMGSVGGWFWSAAGWPGVAGFAAVLLAAGLATALLLGRRRV